MNSKASKFKGILESVREREVDPSPAPTPQATAPKRGRPSGKRSDSEYVQVTAYIPRQVHRDIKIALLQGGNDQEFSELVEKLLSNWLESRT